MTEKKHDVTEKAMQSDKMATLGQIAAGVVHEINNPMAYISSNVDSMKEYTETIYQMNSLYKELFDYLRQTDDPKIISHLKKIQKKHDESDFSFIVDDLKNIVDETSSGITKVNDIVKNLKSFSRVSKKKEATCITEIIEETIKVIWNEIKYQCQIEKHFQSHEKIIVNRGEISQVLINLLVNASHAIEGNGKIIIKTFDSNGHVFITIRDNGSGISPVVLESIFEPFFTTKSAEKGTGLGLPIAKKIIESHEGKIEVESVINEGTTFTICLPVNNENLDNG